MQEGKTSLAMNLPRRIQFVLPALLLVFLTAAGLIYYRSVRAGMAPSGQAPLSQSALEEQYGLRVSLVSVTAAGGMVDLRMKIVDAEKARALLEEKSNFPALYVSKGSKTLRASADLISQEITFEDGVSLFLLYSNAGSIVRRGAPITVRFGEIALEPIEVK